MNSSRPFGQDLPDFRCFVAKHKQHGINHVGLSTSIWSNNTCETFMEWA